MSEVRRPRGALSVWVCGWVDVWVGGWVDGWVVWGGGEGDGATRASGDHGAVLSDRIPETGSHESSNVKVNQQTAF